MAKYVFGHKNPDTDSIVSAILYSNFLKSKGEDAVSVKLGDINNETKYVLEKAGFEVPETVESLPEGTEVVLVDHNEMKQTIDGITELNIDSVIDHHKFNFNTGSPVNIRAEKLGCTCSILYKIFQEQNYEVSKEESILMIAGIISDTLHFRSPTSTEEDKEIMNKLNEIAGIEDLERFALDLFEAKSDLGDIEIEKMVKMDYKEFEFGGSKYGIGVIETTNPDYVFGRKDELIKALAKIKTDDELKGIMVSVIDILNEDNKTFISDDHEAEILQAVFGGTQVESNVYSLGNIVSRKKQIVPKLEAHFN